MVRLKEVVGVFCLIGCGIFVGFLVFVCLFRIIF